MSEVRTLSTDELRRELDRDNGLHVLNVQTHAVFTGALIPASRHIPVNTIGTTPITVSKDAAIVTYCGGPQCSQSTEAARKLTTLGYTNVRVYSEGLEGWMAAGNEIVRLHPMPAA